MPESPESFTPRKRWGQNFLINSGACDTIVRAFTPRPDDRVIEIGPGKGALTRKLAGRVGRLLLIEVDPILAGLLRAEYPPRTEVSGAGEAGFGAAGEVQVVEGDVLRADWAELLARIDAAPDRPARILGNLPFNIATAVILRLLHLGPLVRDLMLMVQREVAERILSPPGRKSYGGLSVLCQTYARVDSILRLGPGSFRPRPKVDSEVVRLLLHDPGGIAAEHPELLSNMLRAAFAQRRKTLQNNLAQLTRRGPGGEFLGHAGAKALLESAGIDPRARAESVPVAGFLSLAEAWRTL
jgi:16S rRNA (adenine1518-N6/adenine1519-N6)-dimethyltransferase